MQTDRPLTHPEAQYIKRLATWERFHEDNPEVFKLFRRFAHKAHEAGAKRIGARLIWERMRWHIKFETTDQRLGKYKLNDHYPPFYARLLMRSEPWAKGLFELRGFDTDMGEDDDA